jgi:hypothetical protein
MSPADRAKHVVAAFKQKPLTDAEMEAIITSAIKCAVAQEREACAYMANMEASIVKGTNEMALGKGAAYLDMAMRIRQRGHTSAS